MTFPRTVFFFAVIAVAGSAAEPTVHGVLTLGGSASSIAGDTAAFQSLTQQRKGRFVGLEAFELTQESADRRFVLDARYLPWDEDLRIAFLLERPDKWSLSAGYEEYRVWYDASGGFFQPTGTAFSFFKEDTSIRRQKGWVEATFTTAAQTTFRLRYELTARSGQKGSTSWGDSNAVGSFGTKAIVPSFYDIDETTQAVSIDVKNDSDEKTRWQAGARYARTELANKRVMRRRPGESADRVVTSKDSSTTDLFSAHGFYERVVHEKLRISAGALRTTLDSNLGGSRIYGQNFDPIFDPAYARRQQRDEGFYGLTGESELRQTVLNLNAVYLPRKHWSLRSSFRYENLHQATTAEFVETNIGAGPAFAAQIEEAESHQRKAWNEGVGAFNARYTGLSNWTFDADCEFVAGRGTLAESLLADGAFAIDREGDNQRRSQKYSLKTNWYPRPGLSLSAQVYTKAFVNDYMFIRDNTPAGTADRYPAYITGQDFETQDVNLRISWRPIPMLSLVSRYDYQRSTVSTQEAGLPEIGTGEMTSHILSESLTWSPASRFYANLNVNVTWDQLTTPAVGPRVNGDNNYVNGSLGAGYALAKKDDLYLDYALFRARNGEGNVALTLPYGADQTSHAAYLTWIRRQTERWMYTMKVGRISNRDGTWAGLNDFDAYVIYAKVQLRY